MIVQESQITFTKQKKRVEGRRSRGGFQSESVRRPRYGKFLFFFSLQKKIRFFFLCVYEED